MKGFLGGIEDLKDAMLRDDMTHLVQIVVHPDDWSVACERLPPELRMTARQSQEFMWDGILVCHQHSPSLRAARDEQIIGSLW